MTHVDDLVRSADPLDRDDAFLDPASPQARALLLRARESGGARRPRAVRRPLSVALAVGLAAAASFAVLPGAPAPVDARAAMLQAAEESATFDSGRIVTEISHAHRPVGHSGSFRHDLRFEGDALATELSGREVLPSGERVEHASSFRQIGGRLYEQRQGQAWKDLGATDEVPRLAAETAATRPDDFVELLRRAGDVRERDTGGGGRVYEGTLRAADLTDVPVAFVPLVRVGEPGRDIAVTVEVDADDRLRALDMAHPDAGTGYRVRMEVSELGRPQGIRAP